MKRRHALIIALVVLAWFAAFALMAFAPNAHGQATQPAVRRCGVFAQPVVDSKGVRLLDKWYAGGTRIFMGWASTSNTSGANPAKDRAAQLEWRAAVRALGPDAVYVDYPLPDWRTPAAPADIKLMVDDPQCLGFMAPDEFNRKNAAGTDFVVTAAQWKTYWDAIDAGDPGKSKLRVGDYAGALLSAAWGFYTGADMKPFDARLTVGCTNWHPRVTYGDTRPDCDQYPGRSVKMLAKIAPAKPRWYISECANEKINNTGRAPTAAELDAQYAAVMADDNPAAPIVGWLWFPQEPHPSAAHVFDATTPEQFETVKRINAKFAPTPVDPIAARLTALESRAAAAEQSAAAANAKADAAAKTLADIIAAFPKPSTQPVQP